MVSPLYTSFVGKRYLLMLGELLMALCMLGMGLAYTTHGISHEGGNIIISMGCIYFFFYCGLVSPFSWQVAGEIPSQPLRAHTLGFGSALTYLFGWVLSFTVPYFINPLDLNWGAQYAYIWAVSNFLCVIFVYFVVPETNKRTLEEIDECYVQHVPIRKFPSYECVGTYQAREDALVHYKAQEHEHV